MLGLGQPSLACPMPCRPAAATGGQAGRVHTALSQKATLSLASRLRAAPRPADAAAGLGDDGQQVAEQSSLEASNGTQDLETLTKVLLLLLWQQLSSQVEPGLRRAVSAGRTDSSTEGARSRGPSGEGRHGAAPARARCCWQQRQCAGRQRSRVKPCPGACRPASTACSLNALTLLL